MRHIVFIAPFPGADRYLDGWMSRIKTIDGVFEAYRRTYIDFQEGYPPEREPEIVYDDGHVHAVRLNPGAPSHWTHARRVLDRATLVYVHTLHQCEYAIRSFDPDRMFVDIHGVVPEEELMMGSPERSAFFDDVERRTLAQARWASVVTQAMRDHYLQKYPATSSMRFVHLPVFDFGALKNLERVVAETKLARRASPRNAVIYAGGAQVWQCVGEMLDLMEAMRDCDYVLYSHDHETFGRELSARGLSPTINRGYASKQMLEDAYRYTPFGFALRKPSVVNRVASPTKFCDYFAHAVIPVVDFAAIGDFERYGYAYVHIDEFRAGFLPDTPTQEWMIDVNAACLDAMYREFRRGVDALLDIVETR